MSLIRKSLLFSVGTLLSRVSGLARDMVVTASFGATSGLDAFLVANRIPNLFRDMLAEGALGSAFTKVYSSRAAISERQAKTLLSHSLIIATFVLIMISICGFVFAEQLVDLFTIESGSPRTDQFYQQTEYLTKILFPFLGLAIMGSILSGVLNQRKRFFLSALASVFLNVGYILGALVLADYIFAILPVALQGYNVELTALAFGVLLGGVLMLCFQFIVLIFATPPSDQQTSSSTDYSSKKDLKNILQLMLPAAIAASASSINVVINTNFATSLESGVVSYLTYAFRLFQLPVGLFAVATSSVILPKLSASLTHSAGSYDVDFYKSAKDSTAFLIWVLVPCMLILFFAAESIVALFYQRGAFTVDHAIHTAAALKVYAFGVLSYGLLKLFTSIYFAIEQTKMAMYISLMSIVINFLANYILIEFFGYLGLAATLVITLSFNAISLLVLLPRFGISILRIFRRKELALIMIVSFLTVVSVLAIKSLLPQHPIGLVQNFIHCLSVSFVVAALFLVVFRYKKKLI